MLCKQCGTEKHFNEFYTDGTRFGRTAYRPECKACTLSNKKAAYFQHGQRRQTPEQRARRRARYQEKHNAVDKSDPAYNEKLSQIHSLEGNCKCPRHIAAREKARLDKPDL